MNKIKKIFITVLNQDLFGSIKPIVAKAVLTCIALRNISKSNLGSLFTNNKLN